MRTVVLLIVLLFIAAFATLTALDIGRHGLSALDVVAIAILILFTTGILGALLTPPRQ